MEVSYQQLRLTCMANFRLQSDAQQHNQSNIHESQLHAHSTERLKSRKYFETKLHSSLLGGQSKDTESIEISEESQSAELEMSDAPRER